MYFATASGRCVDITKMSEKDIHISDIAHHLAKICRYGGALPLHTHYSVATHSLNLTYYCMDKGYSLDVCRYALMHDASEAYLGDIVAGLKRHLHDYIEVENKVCTLIYNKYGIKTDENIAKTVKEMDARIVLDEACVFMKDHYHLYRNQLQDFAPLGVNIHADGSLVLIKQAFLHACDTLQIKEV